MSKHLPLAPLAPMGCRDCAYVEPCGGLESQQSIFGCFEGCGPCGVARGECDYTCPRKPREFLRDWVEVGGLRPQLRRDLPSPTTTLPIYVPMIRHGSGRQYGLPVEVVAVNTFDLVRGGCAIAAADRAAFRERFGLESSAKVLLVSVKQDRYLEDFWAHRSSSRLEALSQMDVLGITAPNFSFFEDAPRTHTLRNLWRIVRAAEVLADAGMRSILHVNSLVREDWSTWARVLKAAPAATYVCKEFQTGFRDRAKAVEAVEGLASLRDRVGRDLHPIAVAGRKVAGHLAKHFDHFTIVDSVPFLATVHRKRLEVYGTSVAQRDNPTADGDPLDDLLHDNVRAYERLVKACAVTSDAQLDVAGLDDLDAEDSEPDAENSEP